MNDTSQKPKDGLVACEVCLKEIPASGAKSEETSGYVAHFCGLECYDTWKEQKQEQKDDK